MNCYNSNCKENCDDIKKMYCIHKLTEKQNKFIAKIKNNCKNCGGRLVQSKYVGQATKLCTSCGIVKNEDKIVKYCLVNSRRAS